MNQEQAQRKKVPNHAETDVPISGLAIVIGAVCAIHLGIYAVFAPVVGALIVGVIVRYGSERIRGHGIPEAIEAILIIASRPRLSGRGDKLILVTVGTSRSC